MISDYELGRRIQQGRRAAGRSQAQLSEALGTPVHVVQQWEQGLRRPSEVEIELLCSYLGLPRRRLDGG